jgi:hypothetical protein
MKVAELPLIHRAHSQCKHRFDVQTRRRTVDEKHNQLSASADQRQPGRNERPQCYYGQSHSRAILFTPEGCRPLIPGDNREFFLAVTACTGRIRQKTREAFYNFVSRLVRTEWRMLWLRF